MRAFQKAVQCSGRARRSTFAYLVCVCVCARVLGLSAEPALSEGSVVVPSVCVGAECRARHLLWQCRGAERVCVCLCVCVRVCVCVCASGRRGHCAVLKGQPHRL